MRDDLPAPEQIMEELADRAIAQIDRRAPVAFEGALDELVRYHRFLIGLHATETEDGRPFSYAEVSGAAWHAPHIDWIRQYRRLFDRAAERIPDEQRFLDALAYVPYRLANATGLAATDGDTSRLSTVLSPYSKWRDPVSTGPNADETAMAAIAHATTRRLLDHVRQATGHPRRALRGRHP